MAIHSASQKKQQQQIQAPEITEPSNQLRKRQSLQTHRHHSSLHPHPKWDAQLHAHRQSQLAGHKCKAGNSNSPAEERLVLTDEEATACDSVPDAVCMPPSRPLTTGALDCFAELE